MTYQNLIDFQLLSSQISTKQQQIKIFAKSGLKSPSLEGMPHGSGISDRTANLAIELEELEERLDEQIKKYKELEPEIKEFIASIEDDRTRLIFRFRTMYGYSWSEVAEAVGGHNTKGSVRAKFISYLTHIGLIEKKEPEEDKDSNTIQPKSGGKYDR